MYDLSACGRGSRRCGFISTSRPGLLVRQVRYADTPVGRNPTQIDYADYREVDGVKIPFRWTLARVNGRFTIQIREAQQNVPIEDAKFAKPGAGGDAWRHAFGALVLLCYKNNLM